MHEASYDLPTYPPQNFDPYTLSSRDFFSPTSNIPTYMASPHGHSTYSNLSSTRLFNGYTGTGLGATAAALTIQALKYLVAASSVHFGYNSALNFDSALCIYVKHVLSP
ncbi:hypothetical protein EW026_g2973 [Hermanssonia centrifuga]|uniref:Uncharacterized protein n=1 Tax=Hermanssonia centrifuga TaxID=98765 RepID=A0A4S4KM90_9APHY|nr:hypothetical protein EW026_g2973 [Hermanssonia centrifuga]